MSTQPLSELKSTAPTSVSWNAMNPFGAKDLTALAATLWGKPRTSEGSQDDPANVEGPTVALRRARDRSEAASRARRPLLAVARRHLREPLTAMLRLNNDWNVRGTDMVAVRLIERQRQTLEVMADLIDSFLEVPVAVGPASRTHRVLLINEDRGVLGALRIYLLCAGYQVFAAANAHEALDRARTATSLIDIIISTLDLTGDDDGRAVIDKARLLLGYNVPAVLLTTQASMQIGEPALVADVFLLRNPVNLDELNALISEVLERPRRSRLARLRSRCAKLNHDEPSPEGHLLTDSQSHIGGYSPKGPKGSWLTVML
jgi:CheY-like chemotaxis protein